ncbi:tRNA (guanosine(46)-N7)-methyltransferase TrmB [Piscinibacter koreensis]|uniref:tRNA (guanine-N(7)-)-methyltransferase n=1 Tax=Piscinibacter koreensis TaxID=2742824 RepID=A0A7Y6NMX2_9BURK|nr:tRNA (guanosine(46)-N7)-methyltransferase TrmB [Schlegelella koreensis]NUZ06022.1 tRNA (guanosine(46)-N7)-methyltransferase TrmB [Schlegelella koreensis]
MSTSPENARSAATPDAPEAAASPFSDSHEASALASSTGAPRRPIRSFVVRAGRIGPGQARALAELAPRYVIPYQAAPFDFAAAFGRQAPLVVEIGFGMGDATARIAAQRPDDDFLGIEVHPPGVGALLQRIEAAALSNLRIVQHDAVEVIEHMVAPDSLAGVHVFFPDPWHKARHNKRRLIQPAFVALLSSRLAPGAYLHCATDWEPYAEQMLEVLAAEPLLANRHDGFAPRPDYRPLTKFEARGVARGHGVWDLIFERR